jgi:hemerythrin
MDVTLEKSPATHDSAGIDKEHQVQIGMLEAFCSLVEKDESPVKILEMLNQLIEYSEVHFMSEQLLMRMYAFPDYEDHLQDHETMIEHLGRIKDRFRSGQKQVALDTAKEMRNFLLGHIGNRDQLFSNYLSRMQAS